MTQDDGDANNAAEGFDLARKAVNSASAKVDDVGRHFTEAVERAKRPETYIEILKDVTKAAPIAMLVTAFIAGAMFGSRRRRYW